MKRNLISVFTFVVLIQNFWLVGYANDREKPTIMTESIVFWQNAYDHNWKFNEKYTIPEILIFHTKNGN